MALPESLEEAAIIDGASPLQTLIRIVLPLSTASIATIGLFYPVWHWNEWFYARGQATPTLALEYCPYLDQDQVMIKVSTAELKYRQSVARLVPAVEEELLIDDPTEPPEALARLDRLPSGRSIPGLAALLADRRRR